MRFGIFLGCCCYVIKVWDKGCVFFLENICYVIEFGFYLEEDRFSLLGLEVIIDIFLVWMWVMFFLDKLIFFERFSDFIIRGLFF